MSFITIYVHLTWATKHRIPYLYNKSIRQAMQKHIQDYGFSIGYHLVCVGGYSDHCHCIVSLNGTTGICDIARRLKGESSHWINQQALLSDHFSWQREFYAASFAEEALPFVREYILNQENHHAKNPSDVDYKLK